MERQKFIDIIRKRGNIFIFVGIIVILSCVIAAVSLTNLFETFNESDRNGEVVQNISLKIIGPEWTISYDNITTYNSTVDTFLFECAEKLDFTVNATYWPSFDSYLVESINGTTNGENNCYWEYYVNGMLADIGCSQFVLKDNDNVEWRFAIPEWNT